MSLNVSAILPMMPTWSPDMRTEKSPVRIAWSACRSSFRLAAGALPLAPWSRPAPSIGMMAAWGAAVWAAAVWAAAACVLVGSIDISQLVTVDPLLPGEAGREVVNRRHARTAYQAVAPRRGDASEIAEVAWSRTRQNRLPWR